MTHQSLWVNMREQYYRQDPTRLEPMIRLHDAIVHAVADRDAGRAMRLVEEHYDIQIEQHYHQPPERPDALKTGRPATAEARRAAERRRQTVHR